MLVMPSKGINTIFGTIQFPTPKDFFLSKIPVEETLEEQLVELFDDTSQINISEIDSILIKYKLDSLKKYRTSLQITNQAKPALHRFFDALDKAKSKKVRIMHYGDSQIEADRITGYLRNELQKKFGGYGTGLFPVVPVAKKMSVNIEYSENWKRYAGFGRKDSLITHMKYGALMAFSRYAPINPPELVNDSITYEAYIKIMKPKASYAKTKTFHLLKIFYSNIIASTNYKVMVDGQVHSEGILSPNTPFQSLNLKFNQTPNEVFITFNGKDGPDIFGISTEGNTGVVIDNIPLRGSSGTIFTKQDKTLLANMYANLNPQLIILEFGGNTVPYIKTDKGCEDYGNWFKSQINFLKRLNPGAAFVVIGPADMSIKDKTEYVTHPYLEPVRDALKEAALSTGCVFWDMYEVMGGKNSMPKWVEAEPSLAAKDYIHFSPKGAKKMAVDFTGKLFELYEQYKYPNKIKEEKKDSINNEI